MWVVEKEEDGHFSCIERPDDYFTDNKRDSTGHIVEETARADAARRNKDWSECFQWSVKVFGNYPTFRNMELLADAIVDFYLSKH